MENQQNAQNTVNSGIFVAEKPLYSQKTQKNDARFLRFSVAFSERKKAVWQGLAAALNKTGVLTEADWYALESLCDCFTDMLECRDLIARQGRTYQFTTKKGERRVRVNPAVHQLNAARALFNEYLVEFGIKPDPTRVIDIDVSDDDLLAQLLNRAA